MKLDSSTKKIDKTIFNLERYPISTVGGDSYSSLVDRCREKLAEDGSCVLHEFVNLPALKQMQKEASQISPKAYRTNTEQNVYYSTDDATLDSAHPARQFFRRSSGFVAADYITEDMALRQMFESEALRRFMEDCRDAGPLFRYADPLGDMVLNVVGNGQTLPWHFDTPEFSVTVMIQKAQNGGEFEYAPNIRSVGDENFDAVKGVLQGDRTYVKRAPLEAGALQMFHGRCSLHRVRPVDDGRERITAVLGYVDEPDIVARPHRVRQLFGRALEIHHEREITDGLLD